MIEVWYKAAVWWGVPIISITNYDMARSSYSDHDIKWYDMRDGFTTTATVCPWMYKKKTMGKKGEKYEYVMKLPFKCMTIVDEEHTGKNTKTQTFSLLKGIRNASIEQGHKVIYLSATPIEKKVNLKSIIYFLGYVNKPDMNTVNSFFKKKIGTTNLDDIHKYLVEKEKCMSMMPSPEFPEGVTNTIEAIAYEMNEDDARQIRMINEQIMAAKKGLSRKSQDQSIGLVNHNRMGLERYKARAFSDLMLHDLLVDKWPRVSLFTNYKKALFMVYDELIKYVDKNLIAMIYGDVDNATCAEDARKYREGEKRILLATIRKGGQSLSFHDTVGGLEASVYISPPTSASDIDQCSHRHYRALCKSRVRHRIVFAKGDPVENSIRKAVSLKIDEIHQFTTGNKSDMSLGFGDIDLYDLCDPNDIPHINDIDISNIQIPDIEDDE